MEPAARRPATAGLAALVVVALVLAPPLACAQSGDPFQVKVDPQAALVGGLAMATLVSADAAAAKRFFGAALGMRLAREGAPDTALATAQRRLWNLPASRSWTELRFDRPGLAEAAQVRVLVMAGGEAVRPDMQARLLGGLSLGFPVADQRRLERQVGRLGITSTAGITSIRLPRGNGDSYRVDEIHYRGPEGLYALGVWREPPLLQVGPIDARAGLGGPAYSGMVVTHSEREVEFYQRVLGWELRRDIEMTTAGPQGGLALPAGTTYRFMQLFAPGTITGYLVMLDFRDRNLANPVVPRIPNRGLVAWSFQTRDLDEVVRRVESYPDRRATLLSRPVELREPGLPPRRAASVLTPSGLLLEILETPR